MNKVVVVGNNRVKQEIDYFIFIFFQEWDEVNLSKCSVEVVELIVLLGMNEVVEELKNQLLERVCMRFSEVFLIIIDFELVKKYEESRLLLKFLKIYFQYVKCFFVEWEREDY